MQRSGKRELLGTGFLFAIGGGWFFVAGFEAFWTVSHIASMGFLILGLALCIYGCLPRHTRSKMVAIPCPTPMHIVAKPRVAPRSTML